MPKTRNEYVDYLKGEVLMTLTDKLTSTGHEICGDKISREAKEALYDQVSKEALEEALREIIAKEEGLVDEDGLTEDGKDWRHGPPPEEGEGWKQG